MTGFESILTDLIQVFGITIVLIIMFLKGLLIGKPIPAIATIVTYSAFVGAFDLMSLLQITLLTALATVIGEFIIFRQMYLHGSVLDKYTPEPIMKIMKNDEENDIGKFKKLHKKFKNKIGVFIFIVNCTPGIRGLASIPAGKQKYSPVKFLIISFSSTLVYHTVLSFIVLSGIDFII